MLRLGSQGSLWRATGVGASALPGTWFLRRFLVAGSTVVRRWGPRWSVRYEVHGFEIGAWLLVLAWLGVPLAAAARVMWRIFH